MARWRVYPGYVPKFASEPEPDEVDEGADLHIMERARMPSPSFEEEKRPARPLVKAAGGKTKLLPEILPRLPKKIGRYYEPFVGGGAVFFALVAEGRLSGGTAVLADMNADLVNLYEVVRDQPTRLVKMLRQSKRFLNEEDVYYRTRAWESANPVERAARAVYLNKTCFNGLFRVNKSGKFNVPFGSYEKPIICDEANIFAAAEALALVDLYCMDFEKVGALVQSGDVVYCDSPYLPISATSNFTSYTKDGFSLADHVRLRDTTRELGRRGAHVLISHSAAPAIRELYAGPDFRIEEVSAVRAINSDATKRGAVKELLISVKRTRS